MRSSKGNSVLHVACDSRTWALFIPFLSTQAVAFPVRRYVRLFNWKKIKTNANKMNATQTSFPGSFITRLMSRSSLDIAENKNIFNPLIWLRKIIQTEQTCLQVPKSRPNRFFKFANSCKIAGTGSKLRISHGTQNVLSLFHPMPLGVTRITWRPVLFVIFRCSAVGILRHSPISFDSTLYRYGTSILHCSHHTIVVIRRTYLDALPLDTRFCSDDVGILWRRKTTLRPVYT